MASPTDTEQLFKTPLFALHEALGAKIVPFAGYAMPVQYKLGVMKEHQWTREHAGLFDVSHMGQAVLEAGEGEDAAQLLETLTPSALQELKPGRQRYSMLLNDQGGILDDLMVARPLNPLPDTNSDNQLYLVVNAACKAQDFALIDAAIEGKGTLTQLTDRALLALQGPEAEGALAALVPDVAQMVFMQSRVFDWNGVTLFISRSGYTGEDGFEISVPAEAAEELAKALLADERVEAIGLGARDLDYLFTPQLVRAGSDQVLTIPVRITGPWADPDIRPDLGQALQTRIDDVEQEAKDRLRQKLSEELNLNTEIAPEQDLNDALKQRIEDQARDQLLRLLGGD